MRYAAIASALLACLAVAGPVVATPPAEPAPIQLGDDAKVVAVGDVLVLLGTNSGEGIDPKVGDLKQLREPPFSAYDSYKLLDRAKLPLEPAKPGELKLPNQGQLTLTLKEVLQPKKEGAPKRYLLDLRITKPDGSALMAMTVKAEPEKIFFIAIPNDKKSILALGIRVAPPKSD